MPDADQCFAGGVQLVRTMQFGNELPQMIMVGIGYQSDSLSTWYKFRHRDLTPTRVPAYPQSGGAPVFMRFIKEELMPFIKKNYRVSDDAAYLGFSYGGEFGLYVLFHEPGLFSRYAIGSPWLPHDNFIMSKYESDYASNHSDLPAIVFMSVGDLEETEGAIKKTGQVSYMKILAEKLRQRNYPGLKLETKIFEGETHLSGGWAAMSRGLRVIYNK